MMHANARVCAQTSTQGRGHSYYFQIFVTGDTMLWIEKGVVFPTSRYDCRPPTCIMCQPSQSLSACTQEFIIAASLAHFLTCMLPRLQTFFFSTAHNRPSNPRLTRLLATGHGGHGHGHGMLNIATTEMSGYRTHLYAQTSRVDSALRRPDFGSSTKN
jgi:hypothetical protein